MKSKVKILGVEYTIVQATREMFPELNEIDGYTDTSTKTIVVDDMSELVGEIGAKKKPDEYRKSVIRHEIIHAFMYESGLAENSNEASAWAVNEEMIDWFAIQSPKIFEAFKEMEIL